MEELDSVATAHECNSIQYRGHGNAPTSPLLYVKIQTKTHRSVTVAEARGGGGPTMTARASGGHREDRAAGLGDATKDRQILHMCRISNCLI